MSFFKKIGDIFDLLKDGVAAIHEVRQVLVDIQPVIHNLQPLIHDMAPVIADIGPLIQDMGPVVHDIQQISKDIQPVIHDTQVQFRGPDLQGWEQLGTDAQGIRRTVVDGLAHVHDLMGSPVPGTPQDQDTLFAAIREIANVLAPIANILPRPFGLEEQPGEGGS